MKFPNTYKQFTCKFFHTDTQNTLYVAITQMLISNPKKKLLDLVFKMYDVYLCHKFDWFGQDRVFSLLVDVFKSDQEWLCCTWADSGATPLFQGQHVDIIWQRGLQS